uniref:Reverse transcriptase domain-containing protein n=1 Tax=Pygocentrus nattereri TaxID=42514 RepID=A0AAR2IVT4_PYGNA
IVVSFNAEKAFDRVEWGYLFFILDKFGFDSNLIHWIRLLYTAPAASIFSKSSPFPLYRGTCQGCLLAPLLFNLAIEPLVICLHSQERFEGITHKLIVHKLSL